MSTLFDVFCGAVGGDTNKLLSCSGPSHVAELLIKCGIDVSVDTLALMYTDNHWSEERTFYLAGIL